MKFNSIRWRLVFSYVLLTVLTVSLVGVLALTLLGAYVQNEEKVQLQSNARAIAQQVEPLLSPVRQVNQMQNLARSLSFLGNVRVRILDDASNVIVDSGLPESSTSVMWMQPDAGNQGDPPFLVPLSSRERNNPNVPWMRGRTVRSGSIIVRVEQGAWGRQVVIEPASSSGTAATGNAASQPTQPATKPSSPASALYASVKYPIGDPGSPAGFVLLDSPFTTGGQILATMRHALLLAGVGAAIIALIAGLLAGRELTAPILALEKSAEQMSGGNLSVRAPERGAGEIGQLARQFNRMAERLQSSFTTLSNERDALRLFIADASHELRTPVTALGNFIELLRGPAAGDEAARIEFLEESHKQVRRMEWITSNLLDLSRLDAGLIQLNRQVMDLGELLQAAAGPFQARAQQKGVRLEVRLPAPAVQIDCDRTRMEMALGNLLDNALKFTPAGGQVTLSGGAQEGHIILQVEDSGSGIAPEDQPHVFERFYRGKISEEGSGLGLAIVQSIVQAHRGQVTIESQVGQGSRFRIVL